ncbi:MAG: hypothetical protein QM680_13530 [Luteolibacter sp.]
MNRDIEQELQDLEARHKAHQQLMEWHRLKKVLRREDHRARKFKRSITAQVLL